jgi:hypothetical protein
MTSIRSLGFGFFFLTFSLSAVSGQISESPKTYRAHRLRPSDEGQQDPSFHVFRQKLLGAISRKDARFLLSTGRSENQGTNFGRPMFSAASRTTMAASIFQQSSRET